MKKFIELNKEKIENKIYYLFEFLISLLLMISIFNVLCSEDFNNIPKYWLIISIITFVSLVIIININVKRAKKQIEKLFLTFIIPIGMIFVVLVPINIIPDESSHIYRAYGISKGEIITNFNDEKNGDIYIPEEMYEYMSLHHRELSYKIQRDYLNRETDYNKLVLVHTVTETYFPNSYIAGGITFWTCRQLNINIFLACYIVKLINFILFILVGYYCIKTIPFGKLLIAIYMFLPMIIQQACSASADTFINSISLLFIVYNLKLIYQEKDLSIKQRILYYLLATNLSLSKYIYFPLVFLSLLIIKNKNVSNKNRRKLIIISICASVFASIVWYMFSLNYVDIRAHILKNNIQQVEQIKYIISNPFNYLIIILRTLQIHGVFYIFSFVGSALGALNINIPEIYILIMLIGLFLIPFTEKNKKALDKRDKIYLITVSIILILLIFTALYITWTPLYNNESISGVQGRYFIPVFILILLAMIKQNQNIEIKNIEQKYFIIYFILNILACIYIFQKFI